MNTAATTPVVYAGFWRRYAALMVDGVLVLVAYSILIRLALGLYGVDPAELSAETRQLIETGAQAAFGFMYHWLMLHGMGATLGKRALGVRVVDQSTMGALSLGQAALRTFGTYISLLLFAIGYLMVVFDPQKRALHDRLARTCVIRT